tara:strand:+ start:418 stop:648 length:231 start_codon:yes stop_codon:yes gene_type:complete
VLEEEETDDKRELYEQKTNFDDTAVDFKPKLYTIRALPKTVLLADIKWMTKSGGESSDNPFAVLKCKKACKTIFTY